MATGAADGQRLDLYVYYRARVEDAERVRAAAAAMQRRLCVSRQVTACLKRRPQAKDGCHTWMEVYVAVTPDFRQALDAALGESDLPGLIDGPRHIETFLDIEPCA